MDRKFCSSCGERIDSNADRCTNCGVSQTKSIIDDITNNKSKFIAALLAFFLGYLGVHHFYLGNNKKGFIYLGLCVLFGISWILAIIDGISMLMCSEQTFAQKYLNKKGW